ncbi:hypothetical protein FJZ19_01955 [Candidatus Pacearchaeota archaeon]|nr:hypothetical protein [Candidatus Pacearchaeota archaeon]
MINKLITMMRYLGKGIDSALDVCTWRVRGPRGVRERDKLALDYLIQGFKNAAEVYGGYDSVAEMTKINESLRNFKRPEGKGPEKLQVVT